MEDRVERDWLKGRLAVLVGASAPSAAPVERSESFAAWRRFLEAIAADRPLVLVFEDVHWAGAELLEFVEHLVDWAARLPFMVVCTTRPELFERRPGWGGGKRDSTTISLAPLSRDETARLIAVHLSEVALPAETQRALLERAGGNPLYAEEFARMLTDRGMLERRGQTMQLTAGADIPVPETVQAVIAARLDTLPTDRKALLHDAAVVGQAFWVGALAHMSGLDERLVEHGLRAVAKKELLRPVRQSSVNGQAELDFVSHYYPNVLEAMRTRWISPQFVSTNRVDSVGEYQQLRELGQRVNEALDIGTSATHMEWFFGPKGLKFSEIGCRPPGVGAWDLYSAGNDLDLYREWANAIVQGNVSAKPSRRFASGIIALRPDRDGNISGYSGLDEIQSRHGEWVIDAHLPDPGTPTQGPEAGYMANAYVRMRHPDYDTLRGMLDDVGRTVQVYAT